MLVDTLIISINAVGSPGGISKKAIIVILALRKLMVKSIHERI